MLATRIPDGIRPSPSNHKRKTFVQPRSTFLLGNVYPLATLAAMSGKDSGLRIRVEKALRDEFLGVCHAQDRPAAQVIREFMRDYVAQTGPESRSKGLKK